MFKNPLKYQQGGKAKQANQEQLVQLFQAAAKNAQVDPQQLVQKASEIGEDEQAAAQFMQGLQLCAQGDPKGIEFIKSLFQSPAFRQGGKVWDFICKHARGGYVAGCGCGQKIEKDLEGSSGVGNVFRGMYDRFVEIPASDTSGVQNTTTGDERVRKITLQRTPERRSVMNRNVLLNTMSLEEAKNRLESTGIPFDIWKDFGKTQRYFEVYGKPIGGVNPKKDIIEQISNQENWIRK